MLVKFTAHLRDPKSPQQVLQVYPAPHDLPLWASERMGEAKARNFTAQCRLLEGLISKNSSAMVPKCGLAQDDTLFLQLPKRNQGLTEEEVQMVRGLATMLGYPRRSWRGNRTMARAKGRGVDLPRIPDPEFLELRFE